MFEYIFFREADASRIIEEFKGHMISSAKIIWKNSTKTPKRIPKRTQKRIPKIISIFSQSLNKMNITWGRVPLA